MNVFDKVIKAGFPGWHLKREQARHETKYLSSVGGAYDAAKKTSAAFQTYVTNLTDANSAMEWDRNTIIKRSREFSRNKGIACAIHQRMIDFVIGDKGLMCHPKIDHTSLGLDKNKGIELQRSFKTEYELFSQDSLNDIYMDEAPQIAGRSVLRSQMEGGDAFTFIVKKKRVGTPFRTKLQLLEGEYVSNPNNTQNSKSIIFGIEIDKSGIPIKVHVSNNHPGDLKNLAATEWTGVDIYDKFGRPNVLHHWDKLRPGQTRGLPLITCVMEKIIQMETLDKVELTAAVLEAMYVVIFTGDRGKTKQFNKNPDKNDTDPMSKFKMGSGAVVEVPKGVTFDTLEPKRPNKLYAPYHDAIVTQIASAIGFAKSLLTVLFGRSYSASTGEVIVSNMFFNSVRTKQAIGYYQPVYEAAIEESILNGRLQARGFLTNPGIRKAYLGSAYNQWSGPKLPPANTLQEAKAMETMSKMKLQSLQGLYAEKFNGNWEADVLPEILDEIKNLIKTGENNDNT